MMVKEGQVVSKIVITHIDLTPLPLQNECDIPCEGDLLMIRRMLGTIPKTFG